MKTPERCPWPSKNELMIRYHDEEWGVPLHEDIKIFEFMVLDSFQAGLSWQIVLNKREGFRSAFAEFDPEKVALFDEKDFQRLLGDASIIRNRSKIIATVSNARAFLNVQKEFGSFDAYIWQFCSGKPLCHHLTNLMQMPVSNEISDAMSADLKKRGFKFVGTTICYAFMQAAGMVNDHLVNCFRYKEVQKLK